MGFLLALRPRFLDSAQTWRPELGEGPYLEGVEEQGILLSHCSQQVL